MIKTKVIWNKFWYDYNGKLAIISLPNVPLLAAALFFLLSKIDLPSNMHVATQYIYFGFLFTWAWLEITKGESYFRRLLGVVVLVYIIYSHIH